MSERDPGLAFERTTLSWQRTGLASVVVGAFCARVFWSGTRLGLVLAGLFVLVGALALGLGRSAPVGSARLRVFALLVTAAAVLGALLTIVG